jgi:hypothetical protein
VKAGVLESIVLWNTLDLGYLTVHVSRALATGELSRGATALTAGHLGKITIEGDQVMLGAPFVFTAKNIDQFDF